MAWFITRVELHDANYQDYSKLHIHMTSEGYKITIRGSDGRTYELPPAEYHLDGAFTRDQALEKAKRAAQRTLRRFSVVTTETNGVSWLGLPVAHATAGLARTQ